MIKGWGGEDLQITTGEYIYSYIQSVIRGPALLTNYFKSRVKCRQALKQMHLYLEPGIYLISDRMAFKSTPKTESFIKNSFGTKEEATTETLLGIWFFLKNMLRSKIYLGKTSNNEASLNGGTLLYISNEGNIKVFDLHNRVVITKYKNKNTYQCSMAGDKTLRQLLNAPKQTRIGSSHKYLCIEPIISGKTLPSWGIKTAETVMIDEILNQYRRFFTQTQIKHHVAVKDYLDNIALFKEMPNDLAEIIHAGLEPVAGLHIPVTPCHGDLYLKNIRYDGEIWHVLDWDDSNEYIFFYDLFKWLLSEMVHGRTIYLKNYAVGIYDSIFAKCFTAAGLHYNPALRQAYYFMFLLEFIAAEKSKGSKLGAGHYRRLRWQAAYFD